MVSAAARSLLSISQKSFFSEMLSRNYVFHFTDLTRGEISIVSMTPFIKLGLKSEHIFDQQMSLSNNKNIQAFVKILIPTYCKISFLVHLRVFHIRHGCIIVNFQIEIRGISIVLKIVIVSLHCLLSFVFYQ